ncbi:MAG: Ig-like domain repeat protein [Actinomycetota bacterium]|nr:Ig-like domain repeat protein [Actinomycetota bacterium]
MTQRIHTGSALARAMLAAVVACAVLISVSAAPAAATAFSNAAAITTTLPACGGAPAQATPYPSPITVSGLTGTVSDVNVTLRGIGNDWGGDLEIFLVGPGAAQPAIVLMSDAGAATVSNATVTFDDSAGSALPQNSFPPSPATAKPADYQELTGPGAPADTYPGAPAGLAKPAPTGSATLASTFNGIAPNGTWNLYVLNDACDAPAETLSSGWTIDITTAAGAATTTAVTSGANPSSTGQNVTFTATVTSGGSPVTTGTVSFTEGVTTLAANVPVDGSGKASFAKSNLPEGNHVITGTYNGVPAFSTSNGSVNQIVNTATTVSGTTFCNPGPIAVRPNSVIPSTTPYPSNLTVSGLSGNVSSVTASVKSVSHAFAEDIDVLLVGPNSANNLVLVSDAGSGSTSNVTLNLSDGGASVVPATGPWASAGSTATARPTDYTPAGDVDTFPSALPPASPAPGTVNRPAPTGAATLASAFGGSNPNGTWSLYVRDDGAPDTGSIAGGWCITVTLTVPPTITSANTTTFTTGTAGSFTVTATGTPTPALSLTSGTLPAGVTFTPATGVLAGTPAAGTGGSYPLTFKAANGTLPDATQAFTLVVSQPPAITSANSTTFMVGISRSFTVTATGFPTPNRSLTSGTLPAGVTFTPATGVLAGTPAAGTTGSYPLTFTASNGVSPNAAQSFTLIVVPPPVPPTDFDGDGTTDLSVYRPSNGSWWVKNGTNAFWGAPGDIAVPADYNGDRKIDYAVYRPSTGEWFVVGGISATWGTTGDIPVPGDYNGDGSADIALYRPSTGAWYVLGGTSTFWGTPGDIPVPGDYNGDGRTDIAVYRPSTGVWYVRGGTSGFWGTPGDVPVPGDYNHDGLTDFAVYRPSTGAWYVLGGTSAFWGTPGDIPEPGDYNGDGRTDFVVYRPSDGVWYQPGGTSVAWGVPGDIALPLPYALRNTYFPPGP